MNQLRLWLLLSAITVFPHLVLSIPQHQPRDQSQPKPQPEPQLQPPSQSSPGQDNATPSSPTSTSPSPTHSPNEWEKNGLVEWEKKKYFKEPGGDDILGHYDNRFYHGVVTDTERRDTLLHLIRSYLISMREVGLDTWIAHGTLLGWWWNGRMLPWDWDVDVQVSYPTILYMGENLNMTKHKYTSPDGKVQREYLLDINPHSVEIERGDGTNIIDARWIDARNGLYIDITALSEKNPASAPGVWSCKNNHKYKTTELYPMRETIYEGVPARIPYSYDSILTEEYSSMALVREEFQGHQWHADIREWVPLPQNNRPGHPNYREGK